MTDSPLPPQTRRFAGTASVVSLHKVAQVAGSVATVVLVPRMLGAENYGMLAFLLSLAYLGQILGDFGTLDVFGRFVPPMSEEEAGRLYMRTLAFKLPVGAICGAVTAAAALMLGAWVQPVWALMLGLGVALHILAWVPFQFALGRNRVGAWMTEQAWRQWALLLLLVLLYPIMGMDGVLLALLVMEALFLFLGLGWARRFWRSRELRFDWPWYRPFVLAGAGFFAANITVVALYRSGPALVGTLTGETAQAGIIDLAIGLFLVVYVTVSQFAQSLIPVLSDLRARDQIDLFRRWLGSFMRIGVIITLLGVAGVWLLADWGVPLVFGAAFAPAAEAMKWISLGMPLAVLAWAGNVTATVDGRGRVKFEASLLALAVFVSCSAVLVPDEGAAGAAMALSLAVLAHALVLLVKLPGFGLDLLLPWFRPR